MAQAMCTSFKQQLFAGRHDFTAGGHNFRIALFTGAVVLDASTAKYSTTGEVVSPGYSAGGAALVNVSPTVSGTTVMVTFGNNPTWTGVTFTTSQALIYNYSQSGDTIAVFDFGGGQSVVNGTFTITMPLVSPTTALIRLI